MHPLYDETMNDFLTDCFINLVYRFLYLYKPFMKNSPKTQNKQMVQDRDEYCSSGHYGGKFTKRVKIIHRI